MPPYEHNHIVTRAHLELFTREGVLECHFHDGTSKPLRPARVAVRKDFYVARDASGTRDTSLEQAMGPAESAAVAVLRDVAGRWPLQHEDRVAVTEYLALQALRTPAFRHWHERRSAELLDAEHRRSRWGFMSDEQWHANVDFLTGDEYRHETMMRLLAQVSSLIGSMHWSLLAFSPARVCFSDQPFVTVASASETVPPFDAIPREGFGQIFEARFPVDPRHALLLTWWDVPEDQPPIRADREVLRDLNAAVIGQADRQWFHRPGPVPPHGARPHRPIASRLLRAYDVGAANRSRRREFAIDTVKSMIESREMPTQMRFVKVRGSEPAQGSTV
jgi:hypothetical protein